MKEVASAKRTTATKFVYACRRLLADGLTLQNLLDHVQLPERFEFILLLLLLLLSNDKALQQPNCSIVFVSSICAVANRGGLCKVDASMSIVLVGSLLVVQPHERKRFASK